MTEPLITDKLIAKLDAELTRKSPKAILVCPELFTYLQDRGRISKTQTTIHQSVFYKLDNSISITVSNLPADEWFRMPNPS